MSMPYAPPTRVTLISHPATGEQKAGIFPSDASLDSQALMALGSLAWAPPAHSRVATAPEMRTRQTAAALKLDAIETADLRECDFGCWVGRSLDALPPDDILAWLTDLSSTPHGGESFHSLITRVGNWLDGCSGAGSVVAVTHATVIRAAVVHALQLGPHAAFFRVEVAPLTLTDLRLSGDSWRVRSLGIPLLKQHT